eukprot:3527941-Rhodomonas_salina.2
MRKAGGRAEGAGGFRHPTRTCSHNTPQGCDGNRDDRSRVRGQGQREGCDRAERMPGTPRRTRQPSYATLAPA